MKVRITFELADEERRAIAARVGDERPARRENVASWIEGTIRAELGSLVLEYEQRERSNVGPSGSAVKCACGSWHAQEGHRIVR